MVLEFPSNLVLFLFRFWKQLPLKSTFLAKGNLPFFSQSAKETCGGLVLQRLEREGRHVLRPLHCVPLRRRKTWEPRTKAGGGRGGIVCSQILQGFMKAFEEEFRAIVFIRIDLKSRIPCQTTVSHRL